MRGLTSIFRLYLRIHGLPISGFILLRCSLPRWSDYGYSRVKENYTIKTGKYPMETLNENWIIDVLYDLASASKKIGQYELSEDIASAAFAYDASFGRLDKHAKFMASLFDELAVSDIRLG